MSSKYTFLLFVLLSAPVIGCGMDDGSAPDDELLGELQSELSLGTNIVYDVRNQCDVFGTPVHCCPTGFVMIGAHLSTNVFKCRAMPTLAGSRFGDFTTQRFSMHACPLGSVMVGLHANKNILLCQNAGQSIAFEQVDTSTQDSFPMHVCGANQAMSGIHVSQNKFLCAQ